MKVTVCQLPDQLNISHPAWQGLLNHVSEKRSDVVLLPEWFMGAWLPAVARVDEERLRETVALHEAAISQFEVFGDAMVTGSRPVMDEGHFFNEGFVWQRRLGYRALHRKYYLPEEEGFWEASWYRRGNKRFVTAQQQGLGLGYLICTELWFSEWARHYGKTGTQLLLTPRATAMGSRDKWLAGGRCAAVVSGCFSLSSNRGGTDEQGCHWAGAGWIIDPEEGEVLAVTDEAHPYATEEIDLQRVAEARKSYPRYVTE